MCVGRGIAKGKSDVRQRGDFFFSAGGMAQKNRGSTLLLVLSRDIHFLLLYCS